MRRCLQIAVLLFMACALFAGRSQAPAMKGGTLTTQDRMSDKSWWPTKGDAPGNRYAGAATCRECHGKIAAQQAQTPMYHAGIKAPSAEVFKTHDQLELQRNDFNYTFAQAQGQVTFSVKSGADTDSELAPWAFGAGVYGQTYMLERDGRYTESRLSYFTGLNGLDITPGQGSITPHSVDEALGKRLDAETAQKCFRCHTTESVTSNVLDAAAALPGVMCESCHGPGAKHVAVVRGVNTHKNSIAIVNPAHLSPSDSVDFCGACHRTWADVALEMPANIGVAAVRFQPYRLEMSKCWGKNGDARIICIACHDPHQPLVHETAAYDVKCLACHSAGPTMRSHTEAKTCKVGKDNCVSCHMPKVSVPETHATFTDHDIRVVRGS